MIETQNGETRIDESDKKVTDSAGTSENYYIQLLRKVDYGEDTTYVIGHKSPNPDSIGSAIALAELLNKIGVKAVAAASERIDKESDYALEYLGIEKPLIMDNAEIYTGSM